jgi:hypothetical protein
LLRLALNSNILPLKNLRLPWATPIPADISQVIFFKVSLSFISIIVDSLNNWAGQVSRITGKGISGSFSSTSFLILSAIDNFGWILSVGYFSVCTPTSLVSMWAETF